MGRFRVDEHTGGQHRPIASGHDQQSMIQEAQENKLHAVVVDMITWELIFDNGKQREVRI